MVSLKLNFLGVSVSDFPSSYRFYTDVLGVRRAPSDHEEADWAMMGKTWEEFLQLEAPGMVWELFGGAPPPPDNRAWGQGQGICPGIQVKDLEKTVADLRTRGVTFMAEIQEHQWGQRIEFRAPEGIQWSLANAEGFPFGPDLNIPHIGWVELKAKDLDAQVAFYKEVMGLGTGFHGSGGAMLRQGPGEAVLFLEPGGEMGTADQAFPGSPVRQHPVWISFMTFDVQDAISWFEKHGVTFLQRLTQHPDWGGTDIIIADVDGNAIQVVQYDHIGNQLPLRREDCEDR